MVRVHDSLHLVTIDNKSESSLELEPSGAQHKEINSNYPPNKSESKIYKFESWCEI